MAEMLVVEMPDETHILSTPHTRHPGFSPGSRRECQNTTAIVLDEPPAWIPACAGMT